MTIRQQIDGWSRWWLRASYEDAREFEARFISVALEEEGGARPRLRAIDDRNTSAARSTNTRSAVGIAAPRLTGPDPPEPAPQQVRLRAVGIGDAGWRPRG